MLNLLQSADMAYKTIDEEAVYLTAGAAVPRLIEGMFQSLLNDGFEQAYKGMLQVTRVSLSKISLSTLKCTSAEGQYGLWIRIVGHY